MNDSDKKEILLAISVPPFWHCGRTVRSQSIHMLIALTPAVLLALLHWGLPAARVMALSMLVSMATEAACQKLMEQKISLEDGTAAITGLLLAFLLPATAPWWLVIIAAICAMGIGRMAFGGLGSAPVNATLVGWAMVFVSFPVALDPSASLLTSEFIDPLVKLKNFGAASLSDVSMFDLLAGRQLGGLGATQSAALLLGGLYISARGIVQWQVPAAFLMGTFLTATCFWLADSTLYASPVFHLFTGSTILAAFFLATEASCSPHRPLPMLIYGFIGGALVILIRIFGVYADGAPFAVMLINLLAPMCAVIPSYPFGTKRRGILSYLGRGKA